MNLMNCVHDKTRHDFKIVPYVKVTIISRLGHKCPHREAEDVLSCCIPYIYFKYLPTLIIVFKIQWCSCSVLSVGGLVTN